VLRRLLELKQTRNTRPPAMTGYLHAGLFQGRDCFIVLAMARRPLVPAQLTRGPFTLDEARCAGLKRWHLEGASWSRLASGTYIWAGHAKAPEVMLAAAQRRLPSSAVFSGLTAAWLHGLDVEPCDPIEATIENGAGVSSRSGVSLRRTTIPLDDAVSIRAFRATPIVRTLLELCGRLSVTEATVLIDMALRLRATSPDDLSSWISNNPRWFGVRKLRRAACLADGGAESPMETRLRMLLVLSGLPRPQTQVSLHDHRGGFLGRPDLYYAAQRLGIEYDGAVHRSSLVEDNRRQNRLQQAGIRLLRFTAGDLLHSPGTVVAQVRGMLGDGRRVPQMPANSALHLS
jgi:very-short-patch-repair endonuclease